MIKDFIFKVKWLYFNIKPILFKLIFIIIVGSLLSIISVYKSMVYKSLVDSAVNSQVNIVSKWFILLLGITIFQIILKRTSSLTSNYATNTLLNSMQNKLYKHITYSEWLEQNKYHSMGLISRVTDDVSQVVGLIMSTIPSIISTCVLLVTAFFTLFNIESSLAIVIVLISPVVVLIGKIFKRKMKAMYLEMQELGVTYKAFMQESLNNTLVVKTFCYEEENIKKLNKLQQQRLQLSMKRARLGAFSKIILSIGSNFIYFLVLGYGMINLSSGKWSFGTLTALLTLSNNIKNPFASLAKSTPSLIASFASLDRILELENLNLEVSNNKISVVNNEIAMDICDSHSIVFDNVSFEYKKDKTVLNDVSFKIDCGEKVAFIGPSGEGKTTIIKLILSLIHPQRGNIYIYNNDLKHTLTKDHRELISYVPQGNTLFSGSIKENLLYGNYRASDEEIDEALKMACAYDFVYELENKIDTLIGEKGLGISEGQAQRIAIARAFLRKRPVLILDEATASLDPDTELRVLNSVCDLDYNPTCIIITHRPSALDICDKIFKLNSGSLNINRV